MERIRDLTHDIKELRISLIAPETIRFTPGQYVQLQAPAYGSSPEPVYRAYSMSGPPSDEGAIETITGSKVESIHTDISTVTGERVVIFTLLGGFGKS